MKLIKLGQRTLPQSPKLMLWEAIVSAKIEHSNCAELFERALSGFKKKKDPNVVHALVGYGVYLNERDDFEGSNRCYQEALPLLPDPLQQAMVERGLADNYRSLKNWETARKYANNACHHDPRNSNGFFLLGVCYLKLGKYQEAQKWLLKAHKMFGERASKNSELNFALALTFIKLNERTQAETFIARFKLL